MLQEERKRMLRLETSTFITRFRHLEGPKGHRTFLVLTLQHGNSVGCNFTQSPFMQWNHRKSRYKNLWEFKKIPNSFLLLQLAVKLRLSYALKTMSLEIFLSRFFRLHVVWTQQLLRQIKLKSLESLKIMHVKILGQIQFAWRPFPQRSLDWQLTISHQWPLCELDLFGIHLLIQKFICISSYSLADMK